MTGIPCLFPNTRHPFLFGFQLGVYIMRTFTQDKENSVKNGMCWCIQKGKRLAPMVENPYLVSSTWNPTLSPLFPIRFSIGLIRHQNIKIRVKNI